MTIENLTIFFFFSPRILKIISAITVQCHFHDLYPYIYLTKTIANNPIVKALKEYKGSNKRSHLHENHWQKTGMFSRLHYSCMKTVLEVVHHAQLTAENFNSISLIYFIYYWQVIHTQWLLNPQPYSTRYSYKGRGAIWTRAY